MVGADCWIRRKKHAKTVLGRLVAAVDAGTFSPEGEQQSLGSGQRLSEFIKEWKTHYAEKYRPDFQFPGSNGRSHQRWPGNLQPRAFGRAPRWYIERWLNRMQTERKWSENSWNRYYELLHSLFNRAIRWKRLKANPMLTIDKRVGAKRKSDVRIEEDVEDRLLAACDLLNRPQHEPHSKLLTWEKVEQIRERVAAGKAKARSPLRSESQPASAARSSMAKSGIRRNTERERRATRCDEEFTPHSISACDRTRCFVSN